VKKDKKQPKILIAIIIIALILDQITKIIAYKQGLNIVPNESVEASNNGYYIIMSIIIVLMLIKYISNDNTFIKLDTKIILSLAISGAVGNLIDRIWNKDVIVFIKLGSSFNLNLAYIYIGIAWIGLAVILTRNSMKILKDKKNKKVIKDEYKKNQSK
jgi:lipoprotein signal peptidase